MVWSRFARNLRTGPSTEPPGPIDEAALHEQVARLNAAAQRRLGRSLSLRHMDAGSCNGCELELHALSNILYDLERFGLRFVASPRHADVLMITGPITRNLVEALERTADATPDPKYLVAIGDCPIDGGVFKGSYAVLAQSLRFDLAIRGCPPTPTDILDGLRLLIEANAPPRSRR